MNCLKGLCILAMVEAVLISCKEEEVSQTNETVQFQLQAQDVSMTTTRTGSESDGVFDSGTKYRLYAIDSSEGMEAADWGNPVIDATATETDGIMDYITSDANAVQSFAIGQSLSFYAVTYASTTEVDVVVDASTSHPTVSHVRDADNVLPDLRRAELEDQTQTDMVNSQLTLPFKHTLAKLRYQLIIQNSDELTDITVTGIKVKDYVSGTLDIATGVYTYPAGDGYKADYTVLTGGSYTTASSSSTTLLQDADGNTLETLIFPNVDANGDATEALELVISYTKGSETMEHTSKVVSSIIDETLGEATTTPFIFLPNYYYVLQITVINDDVSIIAIVPQQYEWIDVESSSLSVGQPIVFNNLMWADRNLGAEVASPTTDQEWENARGYYYQLGRSVPFTVDYSTRSGLTFPQTSGGDAIYNSSIALYPYPVLPGVTSYSSAQSQGYGVQLITSSSDAIALDRIAQYVGDEEYTGTVSGQKKKYYNFIAHNYSVSGGTLRNWDYTQTVSLTNWANSIDMQPCPKGWRLPTIDEWKTIFPTDRRYGDITFNNYHSGTIWRESASDDPESGYCSVYVGYRESETDAYGVIYGIKYQGTDKAYRIRWEATEVGTGMPRPDTTVNSGRGMLVISKHNASKEDDLSIDPTADNYVLNYDWDHPTDVMNLPVVGYIPTYSTGAGLIYNGCEVVMGSSTARSAVRIKFLGDTSDRYLFIYRNEYPGQAVQIRCVRDYIATD